MTGAQTLSDRLREEATQLRECYGIETSPILEAATALDAARAREAELVEALQALTRWSEDAEVQIEYEWGSCRSLERLIQEDDLSVEIATARAVLARVGKEGE